MKFLSVSPNARAAGMGSAMTSVEMGAEGALYNPAAMSRMDQNFNFSGGLVEWIADINYNNLSLAYRIGDGTAGVVGFNLVSVDYGDIQATIVDQNAESGYRDVGFVKPTAMALGFSYANAISDQFSVGANFRYVTQDLGEAVNSVDGNGDLVSNGYTANKAVIDFGVLYKTGFESLNFGMSLRNFSTEVQYDEVLSELPLTFRIGLSMDVLDLTNANKNNHSLLVSVDANRPRDFDEQLVFGTEYTFINRFKIRGGYAFPSDEEGFSAGFGLKQPVGGLNLNIDYAYTEFGVFGSVNRFSIQFDF